VNILIVSKIFYPSNRIGAVRPTNFAKYLAKFGHKVTVIAGEDESKGEINLSEYNIIRIPNSGFIKQIIKINNSRVLNKFQNQTPNSFNYILRKKSFFYTNLINYVKRLFNEIFDLVIEIDWYLMAIRKLKTECAKDTFDVTLSSFGPLSSFLVGKYAKKKKISSYWISDFRDNMKSSSYSFFLNKLFSLFEKEALKKADLLTFVSIGQKFIFLQKKKEISNKKEIHVLYNGYENSYYDNLIENNIEQGILNLTYTGQLYYNKSDFSMLFSIIDELISEGKINNRNIKINYAGQSSEYFNYQISKYKNIKEVCENHGYVSKQKSLELQKHSDILLVFAWNTLEEQGILTGKFVEYLSNYKPIISLTSGNKPFGELTQMVCSLDLGIACEYCNYDVDKNRLKEYILNQYNLKLNENCVLFNGNLEKIKKFHYEQISYNLLTLITNKLPKINNL